MTSTKTMSNDAFEASHGPTPRPSRGPRFDRAFEPAAAVCAAVLLGGCWVGGGDNPSGTFDLDPGPIVAERRADDTVQFTAEPVATATGCQTDLEPPPDGAVIDVAVVSDAALTGTDLVVHAVLERRQADVGADSAVAHQHILLSP